MFSKNLLCAAVLVTIFSESRALNCYQCNGSNASVPFQCNEWLSSDIDIKPEPCDGVYEAKYCIKHVGRFEGRGLNCYQCSSSETMDCSDSMVEMGGVQPQSCDQVFEAQYCIKSTSLDGGIGTKRYCSALDLGNYCNYVKQPGDTLTYRSCVYTCTGDGCNTAGTIAMSPFMVFLLPLLIFICSKCS